ncbi:hypothetical protein [Psychroflexus sp. MBR-150]|jgi:hypothetical protein
MKKISIFFSIHFFIVSTLSIYLFIDAVSKTKKKIPVLTHLKNDIYDSNFIRPYLVFSGINTGYGFYGINVATNKFFLIEILDEQNCIVEEINVSNFKTKNSFQRFHTLPSWLYNFKVETTELKEKSSILEEENKYIELRDEYVKKINKHILKSYIRVEDLKENYIYRIKLITVVPPDIWKSNLDKNNIYVLEEHDFKIEDLL